MPDIVEVVTTVDSREEADRLATLMTDARLAACVQIQGPLHSVYRWHGRVTHATEWRCAFKTTKQDADRLRTRLVSEHRYDVPEILISSVGTTVPYAEWIAAETGTTPSESTHHTPGGSRE